MKKQFLFSAGWLFTCALAVIVVACGKGDQNNSTAAPSTSTMAVTPQPCNVNSTNGYFPYSYGNYTGNYGTQTSSYYCQNNQYQGGVPMNWSYGSWYWPSVWQPTASNCGCPIGYFPVFAPSYGVACAPYTYGNAWGVVYYNYNYSYGYAQNSYTLNTPQVQYTSPAINNCVSSTAMGCDTRLNNCSAGTVCQPVGGGSTIGLCVSY